MISMYFTGLLLVWGPRGGPLYSYVGAGAGISTGTALRAG